ncbi:MAG: ATP-binding protein [Steroidobacteraceae bacterium]
MRSIRTRLLASLLALVAVTTLCAGVITYRRVLEETSSLLDYQLRQMALSLRDQATIGPGMILPSHPSGSDFIIQIRSPAGILIYASPPGLQLKRAILGYADMQLGGARWRIYSLDTVDGAIIQVGQPWRMREEYATEAALGVVLPLILLLLVMAGAVVWIVAGALAPLKRLATEVQRRDAHTFAPIAAPRLPQEAAPLVEELNRLLARLSDAFDKQRAFVADAAHELRSPLTALSLQLQLLDRARDETARAEARSRLGGAMDRAIHLVSQLLTLARSEPRGPPVERRRVSLEASAREAIKDVHSLAADHGIELSLEAEGAPEILGDPDALRTLVRNLVDNAVRYSPAGGKVQVRVGSAGGSGSGAGLPSGGAIVEVEDAGPGIPEGERARAFDRFVRRPESADGGTGLGLAIVKAIADQHDARVKLDDVVPHGLKVTVSFRRPPGP